MDLVQHLEALAADMRYAVRGFLRAPIFALAVISVTALGVGAGTAVFSVVDRILFRSLPYPQGDRLVSFGFMAPLAPQEFMLAYDYLDWRRLETPFVSMGSSQGVGDCDLSDINPVRLRCGRVDYTLLPTLGIQPLLGRNFTAQEDRPRAAKVALISHALWQTRFARDPRVIGKPLSLDGRSATVVGVLPPGFELPTEGPADVLVPEALDEEEQATRRTATLVWTVGRLKDGVTLAQAKAALEPRYRQALEAVSPGFRKDIKLRLRSLRDRQIQEARLASWILLASVLAVLLIACANVSNLLLARAAARQHELAVRSALGAGRGRIVRQALAESTLLALAGGAAGCAIAFLLLRVFVTIAPEGIPRLRQAGLDARVLLFSLVISMACGVLSGLVPAWHNPAAESLTGRWSLGIRRHWFQQGLVAVQICVSLVLLTSAGLLLRTLWNLQNQPLGVRTDGVVTVSVSLGRVSYSDPARRRAFFEELETRLGRIPGVAELAVTGSLPPMSSIMGSSLYAAIDVQGRPRSSDGTGGRVESRSVTPRYFAALGIPILRGRGFSEEDRNPHRDVVIVSDTLARRMFPGEDALGKQIRPGHNGPWRTVIGVAGNVKNNGLVERDDPEIYEVRKHAADPGRQGIAILRASAEPRAVAGWVRTEIAGLDATLPVEIDTLQGQVQRLAARPRFNAVLLGIFAGVGLLLAAFGLYGVMSFLVTQRTREIGVRMALGATPGGIVRMVLGRAARSIAAGTALGAVGSLLATSLLKAVLFHVSARDPLALTGAVAVLAGTALLAAWIPARRAARVDPMEALRQE